MIRVRNAGLGLFVGLLAMQACQETPTGASSFDLPDTPIALSDSEKKLDHLTICAPTAANFPNPLNSTNPYFPLTMGYQWTLEGE